MAPIPPASNSLYLCSLDKCLGGDQLLLSWRQALEALSDLDLAKRSSNLVEFLQDAQSIAELQADLDTARPATPQTKSDFEGRTAAINVTPSQNGQFDIQQVKDDSIWLSKAVNIDEVAALRLIVLEWQGRPAAKILRGYSEEEVISIRQATGDVSFGASLLDSAQRENVIRSAGEAEAFASTGARRTRLIRLYMSERESFLSLSFVLRTLALPATPVPPKDRTYGPAFSAKTPLPWLEPVLRRLNEVPTTPATASAGGDRIKAAIKLLIEAVQRWESPNEGAPLLDDTDDTDEAYSTHELSRVILLLKLISVHASGLSTWPTASNVQAWFDFVDKVSFFETLEPRFTSQQPLCGPIQALVSLITLQLLRLPYAMDHLSQAAPTNRPIPFIYDSACRDQVDRSLDNAARRRSPIASPAILGWSMILQTLRERVNGPTSEPNSDDESSLDNVPAASRHRSLPAPAGFATALQAVLDKSTNGDLIDFYAHSAVDGASVLSVISTLSQALPPMLSISWNVRAIVHASLTLFELTRQTLLFTSYTAEILATVLRILDARLSDQTVEWDALLVQSVLAEVFTKDKDIFVPHLLSKAQTRYPYELSPFIKLCKTLAIPEDADNSLCRRIVPLADPTSYFTQELPRDFVGYKLVREDENANSIQLTQDLPMFLPRRTYGLSHNSDRQWPTIGASENEPLAMVVPTGTIGLVMNESKPFIVAWELQHSVLRYLGCLLSSKTPSSVHRHFKDEETVDRDAQADIIAVITAIIVASKEPQAESSPKASGPSPAMWVLEEASDFLGRNQDIVSVVFEIYEQELSRQAKRTDDSVELLLKCLAFFSAALSIAPGRIWPLLARSSLLSVNDRGSKVAALIGSLDIVTARFSLIVSYLTLYDTLLLDVVTHVTQEKTQSLKRFDVRDERSTGLPQNQISRILFTLTRTMLSLLDSTQSWPTGVSDLREIVMTRMASTFNRVVSLVYCNGDVAIEPSDDICGSLAASASLLLDAFLFSADAGLATNRLFSSISDHSSLTFIAATQSSTRKKHIIEFLATLLRISFTIKTSSMYLEKQLFRNLPLLARCYVTTEAAKPSILKLLTQMVRKAGLADVEPPSLLGHLGPEAAKALLSILQTLSRPLAQVDVEVGVWDLAAEVVANKQQWFSSFLITGDIPKRASKDPADSDHKRRRALLSIALDTVSRDKSYASPQGLAMLRFISRAQSHFPVVAFGIKKHDQFLSNALHWVADLRTTLSGIPVEQANQTYAAAVIADILAMYVHNLRQLGTPADLDTITPFVGFYRDNGVGLPDYNVSLHSNLRRNFEKSFTTCKLTSFKRRAGESDLGADYFYDLGFGDAVLGQHQAWQGSSGGFRVEFEKANINLSLVEAQILLMKSWQSLVVELSHDVAGNETIQKQLVNVASSCLSNNNQQTFREVVFDRLLQQRADLALVVLQRLVSVRSKVPTIQLLLKNAWQMVRGVGQDPEQAFQGSTSSYYRTTVQVLLLALQPFAYMDGIIASSEATSTPSNPNPRPYDMPPELLSILLEIVSEVSCKGFRSLCAQLHADVSAVDPADFGLLIGLLQTILRIPHISTAYAQLTLRISDTGVHRYATALFSWSDRLLASPTASSDPLVFADLSVSFLRELTNIPQLAEFLATEGILGQLASAPVLSDLQDGNKAGGRGNAALNGHQAPHLARLRTIWSRSVLPLILNTLISAGPSFAPEAAAFLSEFPSQLARASQSLDPEGGPRPPKASSAPTAGTGSITLPAAAEVHTLCMIDLAIASAMSSPAGVAGSLGDGMPTAWDRAGVKEDLEVWLGGGTDGADGEAAGAGGASAGKREALRERVVPTSEWEEGLQRVKDSANGSANRLEAMIVAELKGALTCLNSE